LDKDIRFETDVEWDGKCITVWALSAGRRVKCVIPRATIHAIPLFDDAITREIDRDRGEIVDRLRMILAAKVAGAESDMVELHPHDLNASS
jgi:hypothetical protein